MSKHEWPRVRLRKSRGDWCVDLGLVETLHPDGTTHKVRRQFFRETKELAEQEAKAQRDRRGLLGAIAMRLDHAQMTDAAEALGMLKGRYSLKYAASFLLDHKPNMKPVTVQEVYDGLLASMVKRAQDGEIGRRHVTGTRSILKPFAAEFSKEQIADLTRTHMRKWAQSLQGPAQTKANVIRHVNMMFSYALQEEYIVESPMKGIKAPKQKHSTPEHHTIDQVARIMAAAAADPVHHIIVPRLAIGYFSGLRAAEQDKLTWDAIKFDAGIIAVSEVVAKCNVPRPVTISANLMRWLEPYRQESGPVSRHYKAFKHHLSAVLKAADVEWIRNAMRHTFATHHYAYHQSADLTAKELGHMGSYRLLHHNYANSGITKAHAAGYWDIEPKRNHPTPAKLVLAMNDKTLHSGHDKQLEREVDHVA